MIPICKFLCAKRQLFTVAPLESKLGPHIKYSTGICSFAVVLVRMPGEVVILSCTEEFSLKMFSLHPMSDK